MKIASKRTLEQMEIAAELRVHGASWDTIANYLGRHKRLLMRWVRYHAADWERLFNEAEQREAQRAANELARPT
jgi:hypothetical protein